MPYRKSDGETIDGLKSEIVRLEKQVEDLEKKNDYLKNGRKSARLQSFKKWVIIVAISSISFALVYWFASSVIDDRREMRVHNKEAERMTFAAAHAWINKHNDGKGDPWCSIDAAKAGDGMIRMSRTVDCDVRMQDREDIILLACSPNSGACYPKKTKCFPAP